ncbi:hypothetical protein [Novipirellula sp.]|uniref:hypothetical protein n=1 Tax=Novipirellula sp. TaxID=2795430 RepID=UPI003563A71C
MLPSISEHLAQPEIDVATYVRRKRIALAHEISERTKVYLDTKYWVLLRNVRLGRSNCSDTKELLRVLETGVADGSLICPLNADIYLEVMKQDDEHTLMATARLIDDLSLRVCILPVMQRFEMEFFHFVESSLKSRDLVYKLHELVWTRAAYVLGFVTPDCNGVPDSVNMAMQKSFADYMWTLGLEDMLNVMGPSKAAAKKSSFEDISGDLNAGKFAHIDEHSSFKGVFLSEVQGILDVHKKTFCDLFQYIYTRDIGKKLTDEEQQDTSSGQMLANLIYNAFRLNKVTHQLPSLRIGAGLHAALRWDKNRKYKPNDLFDFRHAIAALPYCDRFFTEGSLHHLVQDGNLKFDEYFKCKTAHKPADALALLETDGK